MRSFLLQQPTDLPELFEFLETEAVEVSDWLQYIPGLTRRTTNPAKIKDSLVQRSGGGTSERPLCY